MDINIKIDLINTERVLLKMATYKSPNLFDENKKYLKTFFTQSELNELQEKYKRKNIKDENIKHFTDCYIQQVKKKFQGKRNRYRLNIYRSLTMDTKIKVLWGNCLTWLQKMPSESIGTIVTSPPYYNARKYSQWPTLKNYLDDMTVIIKECYRVLDNHRVFVFNISDVVGNDHMEDISCWGKRKIPLPAYFIKIFEDCGYRYLDDIIWDKKNQVQSSRHKNKSTPWPYYQYPINCYEHILIFQKNRLDNTKYPCSVCGSLNVKTNSYTYKGLRSWECKNNKCTRTAANRGKRFSRVTITKQDSRIRKEKQNIIPYEFVTSWRRDVHQMSPVIKIHSVIVTGPDGKKKRKKKNKLGHTAPFPPDIPRMAIHYYSYKGDIVLDPFAGSFTTAIEAQKMGRIGVGMELNKGLFGKCVRDHLTNKKCEFEEIDILDVGKTLRNWVMRLRIHSKPTINTKLITDTNIAMK